LDDLNVERIFKKKIATWTGLMWFTIGTRCMDWADVAHNRDKMQALVHREENLQFL
jgi:hypothetical protein